MASTATASVGFVFRCLFRDGCEASATCPLGTSTGAADFTRAERRRDMVEKKLFLQELEASRVVHTVDGGTEGILSNASRMA